MEENGRDGKREDGQRGRRQKDTNQMQKDRETPHPDCSESRLTQASSWLKKKSRLLMAVECGWSYLPVYLQLEAYTAQRRLLCDGRTQGPRLIAEYKVALHRYVTRL